MWKRLVLSVVVGFFASVPTGAAADVSNTYSVNGVEVYATSTQGNFLGAGEGSSGDYAIWYATVIHQPLDVSCYSSAGPGCAVTGGSFYLSATIGDTITGTFAGGSITLVAQATGCGNQEFHVVGALTTSHGAGTFDVALDHHRVSIFGRCVTYAATVGADAAAGIPGTVSL
jgi:hypothetical protein